MLHWLRYPFVRFTPALIVGILAFEFLGNPRVNWILYAIILIFIFLGLWISGGKRFFSLNFLAGINTLLMMITLGFVLASFNYQLHSDSHFSQNESISYYTGVVDSWPEDRGNFKRLVLRVQGIKNPEWKNATGKVQLYLPAEASQNIHYGTVLLVQGEPVETTPQKIPLSSIIKDI